MTISTQPTVSSNQREESLRLACTCAAICEEYRGQDTLVLDLTNVTPIVDFFVISTGTSKRQMKAMADEIGRQLKQAGSSRIGKEGYDVGNWILEDFGDIVVHLFLPDTRTFYDLEHLWADAERIDWQSIVAQ